MYYFKNQLHPFGMFPHGWDYFSLVEGVFFLEGKIIDVMGHHCVHGLCIFETLGTPHVVVTRGAPVSTGWPCPDVPEGSQAYLTKVDYLIQLWRTSLVTLGNRDYVITRANWIIMFYAFIS